jgi:HAD superfamily hydrolase (TIGR01493 family)
MGQGPLTGIKACVFDAYGTLFDFASAARSCRDLIGDKTDLLTALWRDKQLQYTWLRAIQGRHADFWLRKKYGRGAVLPASLLGREAPRGLDGTDGPRKPDVE